MNGYIKKELLSIIGTITLFIVIFVGFGKMNIVEFSTNTFEAIKFIFVSTWDLINNAPDIKEDLIKKIIITVIVWIICIVFLVTNRERRKIRDVVSVVVSVIFTIISWCKSW